MGAAPADPDAFVDGDLELIPAPPGAAAAATATASADAAELSATAGRLELPATIAVPTRVPGQISAPGYLTAIAGNRSVLLSWYLSEGPRPISGYLIYRGPSADDINPQPINRSSVTETNYSDSDANSTTGPLNGREYYYRVRAFDIDGRLSPNSDLVSARPSGPLLPPSKLEAAAGDGRVVLSWPEPISTGDSSLAGFRLLRGADSGKLAAFKDLGPDSRGFEDVGLPNGKALFYAVVSVDADGNTSPASPESRAVPYRPLKAPQGLSALGVGDEAVRLKWSLPEKGGTFKIKGYNIYRASGGPVDLGAPPINKVLVPAGKTRYEDGPDDSTVPPKLGTDYSYQVVAVDEEGNPSPASEVSVAGPLPSLTGLNTGEFEVTRGNTLQIRGRKTINASYTWVTQDQNQVLGNGTLGGFQLDQQLQVQLTGKVGRKIKVDVDYDDKAEANQQQKISVVYTGDQQEVFKEFAFGDILMDLNSSRTEFAGYNKSLFGAKLKLVSPDEKLRITAVGAQTKGITETKHILGGYEQARTGNVLGEDKQDLTFQPYRYYYLSRDKDLVEGGDHIVPGSVQIYLDQPGGTIYSAGRIEVVDKYGTGRFYFVPLVPNIDFLVDNNTGLVTFNRAIGQRDNIAVAYRVQKLDGTITDVGYAPGGAFDFSSANMDSEVNTGKTSSGKKMIQYGSAYGANQYDSHMSMQFYKLNGRDILNPQLDPDFKLIVYSANQVPIYQLDPRSDFSDVVQFDLRQGWMSFRVPFPFRYSTAGPNDLRMSSDFHQVETIFSPDQTDAYSIDPTKRTNKFTVHIEYKYKVASYNLRFGIIRGSEVILLNGRRLARDVDYFLDYDSGSLVFSNPDLIKDDSSIDATYEYLPFGGQFTSTIWGTRGEYDLTKDISVGSTFLWNSADTPTEVPDVRSSPYSLQILDGDLQATVPQELLDGLTKKLPLLPEHGGVLGVKASGEIAHSWYKPNTYGRNNESGVAMIDSFEAVDNIVSASVERTSWFPASRPLRFLGDAGLLPQDRRFTKFFTQTMAGHDATDRANNNESPNRSVATIEWGNFTASDNWDAYVYSFGVNPPDSIKSASYIEAYVQVDAPVTLHFDVGIISEDATDNNTLDTESVTGVLAKSQDTGFLNDQTIGSPYPPPSARPDLYTDSGYWGANNNVVDTEDLDGNGQLNTGNQYYSFSHTISQTGTWEHIKIPLTDAAIIGTDLSVVPGNLNYYANIKDLRIWFDGAGKSAGRILIDSIQFKGNKWQVRADPNVTTLGGISVTADTNRFQVDSISSQQNNDVVRKLPPYSPNTDFYNLATSNSNAREQSLQVEYALTRLEQSDGKPYFQARKLLANGQDVDVGVYKNMRVDIYKPHATLSGERMLLRLGSDDQNYFEYAIPLDGLQVGAWNRVTLALDGSDGRRTVLGKPYLRQVRYVTLAIHTLNDNLNPDPLLVDNKEVLWVDNLRLTDALTRDGGAQSVGMSYNIMNGALTIDHRIREVDSDFVKMDQQAVDPQRHDFSESVDTRLNAIQGVPVSVRYEERDRYTEPVRRDDPKYNRIFVDPDESTHLTTANLGFSRIPGVTANSALSKTHTRQIVLPAYVETQRNLLPEADKVVNPNTNRDDLSMNQDLTMKAPTSWWGIGGDELRLEGNFTENKVIFDQEAVTDANLAYKNTERRTRTLKGRYSGSYKAGGWLTVSPSYAYTLVEGEGNIPIPTVLNGQAYYTLNGQRESEGWIPQSRVINPSLQLQFGDLGIIRSPRTVYNFTQTRDYIRNDLRTPGSLALNGALNLAGLGQGFEKLPSVDMSQTWSVDSDINNDVRVRSVQRAGALDRWLSSNTDFGGRYGGVANQNLPNIALQEQQSPLQSVWWVRIDDLGLGENVTDPLNIENLAITATRRSNTSFNTRFDMPVLPSWTGTFSPRLTLLDERTMSAPEQVVRRAQFTVGSGLEFKEPHIPFWGSLKPSSLTLDYSYSSSDNFLVSLTTDGTGTKEDLSNNSVSHNFTSTLPMRPTDRTALTVSLRWTGTGESNYIAGAVGPTSQRGTWELGPAIKLVYFLNVDKPVKLWDMWPFYGRELRIKQSFRLDNDLTLVMHRESQTLTTNSLPETGSDVYGLRNQIGYNVLDNVKMNFIIDERYNHDIHGVEAVNQGGDYYSIKLELGLEATF